MCSTCDRRRFLRATAGLLGAGGAVLLGGCPENQSAPPITTPTDPTTSTGEVPVTTASGGDGKVGINKIIGHPLDGIEAVIAQNNSREELVKAAVDAYGGMGAFVSSGDTVVIKPNLGWAKTPEQGVDTHPEVVAAVVRLCKDAGAKKVIIGEHSCDAWEVVKLLSGVPEAAEAAGATVTSWEDARLYEEVAFTAGTSTTSDMVALDVLECDVLINCPKFKHHSATEVCGAMKNQMGLILRPQTYHQNEDKFAKDPNLHVNIADLSSAVIPTLTVMDITNSCITGGPKGGVDSVIKDFETVIVSSDMVACDSLSTDVLGICTVDQVPHIGIAADRGLGNILTAADERVKTV